MTREEKCKLAIERGYTYDPETGKIYGKHGKEINQIHLGYIRITLRIDKKVYKVFGHQFAWYYVYKECVEMLDHINKNKTDNKITNLRSVTRNQNMWNLNCKGYTYHKKSNKWQAQILIYRKFKYLGLFNTEEEARNAYLAAKEIYHVI